MKSYESIEQFMLNRLEQNLATDLYYHGVHHTRHVLRAAELICADEKISEKDFLLLKVGILYHDSGFMFGYQQHEEASCNLARKDLPSFELTSEEIKIICGLIMATEIPQNPKTQLEKIIADADLEYLGTDDFETISSTLFEEVKNYLGVKSRYEWNKIQIKFLSEHHYYTDFCCKYREPEKQMHLMKLRASL